MERIVMMTGGVETLDYFSREMAKTLEEMGYPVFFYDLEHPQNSVKKMKKFLKPGKTALITFNFEGLEKESGVYREGEGYIWDTYRVVCYNIAADHPYFYHERFADLPKRYFHISIDRHHEAYMKKFYPEYKSLGFLPLAGSILEEEKNSREAGRSGEEKHSQERDEIVPEETADGKGKRDIDVIFTGNYTELPFFEPYIHWINEEYAEFYRGIIEELLVETDKTVEEVALAHCYREMGENTIEDLRMALYKMLFIDLYVRNYWRGMAVKTLVDAGIRVEVVGAGWEKLDCAHRENLVIHSQTDSAACLAFISRAKISLNVMPWFKDGAHDRVFNSIVNGAVCVSDGSKYLCENLQEGEGICYFDLKKIEELPDKVRTLLADNERRERMVRLGNEKVREKHLWTNRAKVLAGWLEKETELC